MFLGKYFHTLDDKGRITLPAHFRPFLESGVVITMGPDRCLMAFTKDKWQQVSAKIDEQPSITNKDMRLFTRMLFANASDDIPDKQGRVRIPDHLLRFAGITSDVVIVGMNSRIEIWSRERWSPQDIHIEEHPEEIAEHIANYLSI